MMRVLPAVLSVALPLLDLLWNLTHLNIGLVDFYGLSLPAAGFVENGMWPATPYFPAGYPLLLVPFGLLGSTLIGGYVLSFAGAVLALAAVRRLALEFEVPADWTLGAIALAWAMPCFRIVAGSPSVDMLYTGVALWFLWGALRLWRVDTWFKYDPELETFAMTPKRRIQDLDYRLLFLLMGTAEALALLRYHAVLLVLPILLVLWIGRGFYKAFIFGLLGLASAMLLNLAPHYSQQGHWMPSAAGLQVRVGLEADRPTHFASTEELFDNYSEFATQARQSSVLRDYSFGQLATHTLKAWGLYLRRPPVAFALLLCAAAVLLRRLPIGGLTTVLWALGYTLALSPAYYTPRAALLPALALLPVCLVLAARLLLRRPDFALAVASVLLLLSYWPAGRFARADMAQRRHYAQVSRRATDTLKVMELDPAGFVVPDMRIILLPDGGNPWQRPLRTLNQTWLDDPAIDPRQLPGYR
jgi:hypothetical protein